MSFANSLISSTEFTASVEPGITGTPAEWTVWRAVILSPIISIVFLLGPIKWISFSSTFWANVVLSDRKPYPGWIALEPVISAAPIIRSIFK